MPSAPKKAYAITLDGTNMAHQSIQLIVGLGNPGTEYEKTRHNAGIWFVDQLLAGTRYQLKLEKKFKGFFSQAHLFEQECMILVPTTYMNNSGEAVSAIMNFYKIPIDALLIIHDELDLPPGTVRLKQGGGHGGHNGLQSIIHHLNSNDFLRLRIGIGHPGDKDQVSDFVLTKPTRDEKEKIDDSIVKAYQVMPDIISGNMHAAMQVLHTIDAD